MDYAENTNVYIKFINNCVVQQIATLVNEIVLIGKLNIKLWLTL